MRSYLAYIPLGIVGLVRWLCWLLRRVPASFYRPVRSGHREPLTIVTPVYQEDPDIFRQAIESWLRNDVHEVICVIDVTDTTCLKIASRYPVTVIPTDVPGKRDALRRGWEAASTPLVALVDSDTIWADDVAARVCEPFVDPSVGGVGTRQSVYNPQGFWQNVSDMYLDYRYFDENAAQTVVGRAVSCLSGRTAVYRRDLLLAISYDFMHETFLGVPCLSGDDKRLTMLALRLGYKTYLQRNARVWSTFPSRFSKVLKQRLRWARNTWRSDLRVLCQGWVLRRHPFLAFTMIDKAVSSFTLLLTPLFLGYALLHAHWLPALTLVAWWLVSRTAKMLPHLRRRPSSLARIPAFIAVSFLMSLIKIWALLTIRQQLWLTRDVKVSQGQVVRTGVAA